MIIEGNSNDQKFGEIEVESVSKYDFSAGFVTLTICIILVGIFLCAFGVAPQRNKRVKSLESYVPKVVYTPIFSILLIGLGLLKLNFFHYTRIDIFMFPYFGIFTIAALLGISKNPNLLGKRVYSI